MIKGVGAVTAKPVLFLHIPKTAGTSFLLMLQNAFGDNRVRRIKDVDDGTRAVLAGIVERELDAISCLTGHLPLWLFDGQLDRFAPFTVLREPVSRVLSLYRFTLASSEDNLNRLGLKPDSTLREFLDSRHPEIYVQANNGMVRFLSGDARLWDFDCAEFWGDETEVGGLDRAVGNLRGIDFGLTEDMRGTLERARSCWRAPYELREYRENLTQRSDAEDSAGDIARIFAMNAYDLALYNRAQNMLAARTPAAAPLDAEGNPRAVFQPALGAEVAIGDIPGRQGFYETEADGFAWLRSERPAEIHMILPDGSRRLNLKFYCVALDYPAADIVVRLNGRPLRHEFSFVNPHWGGLESERFEAEGGLSVLEIEAPLFVEPTAVRPDSPDRRKLGVALAQVRVRG